MKVYSGDVVMSSILDSVPVVDYPDLLCPSSVVDDEYTRRMLEDVRQITKRNDWKVSIPQFASRNE